jgi:predicted phage terminase large subunit-like protein
MAAVSPHITEDALRLAAVQLRYRRANDPWDGPNGTARPQQLAPDGNWRTWLVLAGRGFGKTRTAAEWVRREIQSGRMKRVALVGATASDVRDVMVQGESGLLECCRRAGFGVTYNPSLRRLKFANGAVAYTYSADEPGRLRGPQHDGAWSDEIATWRYAESWDQLQFGLRLGDNPRQIATTTPRPIALVRELMASATTAVTRGSTYDNRANLASAFFDQIITKYEGTTLGRQELMGELIEDVDGALWKRVMILHVKPEDVPQLKTVAVAVDPATTHGEKSDETGLAVAGVGIDGNVYVLHGSGHRVSPNDWATKAVNLYSDYQANEIVAESNQGGEMVRQTIINATKQLSIRPRIRLIHASRGKLVRAEPVVALYEQGRVFHVGSFPTLEDQQCMFPVASDNDDQVDALVHAITAVAPTERRGLGTA